ELDPLEDNGCDGGPIAVCCSTRCRLPAAGTPCDDNNPCTTGDACAADGTCGGAPAPAGGGCAPGSDPCTAVCGATGTCPPAPQPPPACRWAKTCHSTCTEQLKACRDACRQRGQARRECRATCATRSTCTAPGAGIRTVAYVTTACTTD